MGFRRIAVFVAAAAALAAIAWFWRGMVRQPDVTVAPAPQVSQATAAGDAEIPGPEASPESAATAVRAGAMSNPDYAGQLRGATDYLEFARALLPAARAGEHAAQFYIYRALDYCADGYRAYFDRGSVRRTLDDAMRWAAARPPLDPEEIRSIHARCHTLMESGARDLGEREQWLYLAAEGGYPLAMVRLARNLQTGQTKPPPTDTPELRANIRMLARDALRSREPEVIWGMAELTRAGDHVAWMLAACQRGMDCSPQADYVKWHCLYDRNCQPYESLVDIIQRQQADEYPEIEARVRWINEKIDAGDWEALGF